MKRDRLSVRKRFNQKCFREPTVVLDCISEARRYSRNNDLEAHGSRIFPGLPFRFPVAKVSLFM